MRLVPSSKSTGVFSWTNTTSFALYSPATRVTVISAPMDSCVPQYAWSCKLGSLKWSFFSIWHLCSLQTAEFSWLCPPSKIWRHKVLDMIVAGQPVSTKASTSIPSTMTGILGVGPSLRGWNVLCSGGSPPWLAWHTPCIHLEALPETSEPFPACWTVSLSGDTAAVLGVVCRPLASGYLVPCLQFLATCPGCRHLKQIIVWLPSPGLGCLGGPRFWGGFFGYGFSPWRRSSVDVWYFLGARLVYVALSRSRRWASSKRAFCHSSENVAPSK